MYKRCINVYTKIPRSIASRTVRLHKLSQKLWIKFISFAQLKNEYKSKVVAKQLYMYTTVYAVYNHTHIFINSLYIHIYICIIYIYLFSSRKLRKIKKNSNPSGSYSLKTHRQTCNLGVSQYSPIYIYRYICKCIYVYVW